MVGRAGRAGVRRRASVLDRDEVLTDTDPDDCPSGRRAAGSSTPTVRWCGPGWSGSTRPGTGCGNSTPTSPTSAGTDCPPGCAASEVLDRLPLREKALRSALAARDCGALEILVRGVDVDPTRCAGGCGPPGTPPCRWSSPDWAPVRPPGRWRLFAGRRPEAAGTLSAMRTLNLAALLVTTAVLGSPGLPVAGAATGCAAMGGVVEGEGICHVTANEPAYTMDLRFPVNFGNEQAIVDYLTQNRDGFVNVAQTPGPGTCPMRWMRPHSRSSPPKPRASCSRSSGTWAARTRRPGTSRSPTTRPGPPGHPGHAVRPGDQADGRGVPDRPARAGAPDRADPADSPGTGWTRRTTRTSPSPTMR